MPKVFSAFYCLTLLPTALLALGALFGGPWPWLALLFLTACNHIIDAAIESHPAPENGTRIANTLPILLTFCHFTILTASLWAIASQPFETYTKIALFVATGLYFATVSNAIGHELIHRTGRIPFNLGKWIFISLLFGHHTSSHRLIHHPFVATRYDPNSARFNESFYRFFVRAWHGSFSAGLGAENTKRGCPAHGRTIELTNPYVTYLTGNAIFLGLALGFGGISSLFTYIGLCLFAQSGLLLTDYVQHYGLSRPVGSDGKLPPIAPHHSWNAPHWFTRKLTLNAPLHSDHHAKPARPFTELESHPASRAPQLPYSPGIMSIIALNPRHWRKVMNPRATEWANRTRQ